MVFSYFFYLPDSLSTSPLLVSLLDGFPTSGSLFSPSLPCVPFFAMEVPFSFSPLSPRASVALISCGSFWPFLQISPLARGYET
jgi:hypothetical protein